MNLDEFSFFNQQLAGMLKEGIPLERGLQQLCESMRRGALRDELQRLEADLAKGTPLPEALAARQLPEFYKNMVVIGARGNDLPGMLLLVADYYSRVHSIWTRLKGLLVYPLIVLLVSLALSIFLTSLFSSVVDLFTGSGFERISENGPSVALWILPAALVLTVVVFIIGLTFPKWQRALRWSLPGFKEASLSQTASAMNLLLRGGSDLPSALALVGQMETGTPAAQDISVWQHRLAAGQGKFADMTQNSKTFPPLFLWLVTNGGEDMATGFKRAAEIYYARAVFRVEMVLYAALPVSVLGLGLLILFQYLPLFRALVRIMDMVGDTGVGK